MLIIRGAGNGIRTRDTKLGKLVLYQLSYARLSNRIILRVCRVSIFFYSLTAQLPPDGTMYIVNCLSLRYSFFHIFVKNML